MNHWTNEYLLQSAGQHIASVKGMRVQVLEAYPKQADLWPLTNGNLLVIVLAGKCTVETSTDRATVSAGDQVLFHEGEQFRLQRANAEEPAIVQMIWAPGISHGEP